MLWLLYQISQECLVRNPIHQFALVSYLYCYVGYFSLDARSLLMKTFTAKYKDEGDTKYIDIEARCKTNAKRKFKEWNASKGNIYTLIRIK